jgi:hypothetical protein
VILGGQLGQGIFGARTFWRIEIRHGTIVRAGHDDRQEGHEDSI